MVEVVHAYELNIVLDKINPGIDLRDVALALHKRFGRVALLIDEYDSPILHDLQNHDMAHKMRAALHRFFGAVKGLDEYIDFIFITGVSAFSKAGLFSGMNDLQVITLRESCADICGYTDTEVDLHLTGHLESWAQNAAVPYDEQRKKIREWYNGYRFSSAPLTVYSPFSIMHALHGQTLENFWFSSATPKLLVGELKRQQQKEPEVFENIAEKKPIEITKSSLGSFDIGLTPLPALMFQTGYLTITSYDSLTHSYLLAFPNREVEQSLQLHLLSIVSNLDGTATEDLALALSNALIKKDIPGAMQTIRQLCASLPYPIHGTDEKHYHALLYVALKTAGLTAQAEFATSHGRADIIINLQHAVYVIEVKFTKTHAKASAQKALKQIEERKYYEQYLRSKKDIILLGIAFKKGKSLFEIEYETKSLQP